MVFRNVISQLWLAGIAADVSLCIGHGTKVGGKPVAPDSSMKKQVIALGARTS